MAMLGSVELSDDLALPNLKNLALRAGSTRTLVTGGIHRQSIRLSGGQELIVEAVRDGERQLGAFYGREIDGINELRATEETVLFTHFMGSWNVKVIDVDVVPMGGIADPDDDWPYYGTITLLVVSNG